MSVPAQVEKKPLTRQPTEPHGANGRGAAVIGLLERFGLVLVFVIILMIFTFTADQYLTVGNVQVLLGSNAALGILAIGMMIPLFCGQVDLSVGTLLGTSAIVTATCMSRFDLPLVVAAMVALAFGAVVGAINGFLVTRIGVHSFIATLAMGTVLQGLVQWYTAGQTISTHISNDLLDWSSGNLWGIPRALFWLLPVALVTWYVQAQTPFGRYLTSIGSNPNAARLVGVRVDTYTRASFIVGSMVVSLAGILTLGQTGSAGPQLALGALLLPALAAVFLGSSVFTPGRFNVPGTVLAVYFVAFSVNGFQFLGVASWIQQVFNGVALAAAVSMTIMLAKRRMKN